MKNTVLVPQELISTKIYLIRGKKVMLDRDLASLYGVETKQLKRQVKRNIERFPSDFMFELNAKEFEDWRCQIGTSNAEDPTNKGLRYAPYAFTEQGVAQLSSVLNSERAIAVNIQIIRLFTQMRELVLTHQDILLRMEQLEKQVAGNQEDIESVFKALKHLLASYEEPMERKEIGYKSK